MLGTDLNWQNALTFRDPIENNMSSWTSQSIENEYTIKIVIINVEMMGWCSPSMSSPFSKIVQTIKKQNYHFFYILSYIYLGKKIFILKYRDQMKNLLIL